MRKETYRARALENSCREEVNQIVCGEGWREWDGFYIFDDDDGDTYRVDESTLTEVTNETKKIKPKRANE